MVFKVRGDGYIDIEELAIGEGCVSRRITSVSVSKITCSSLSIWDIILKWTESFVAFECGVS